ncbi:MAG: hypothetical protein JSR39_03745 [Verrucomicrobia bacterium]|nr:hypothetical protein [Verrucomicrobiota bacterium]
MKNCAVFSCMGLGDGLITLVLSHNLYLNGSRVTTFHPFLQGLQSWFPTLPIRPFPDQETLSEALKSFDHFFIIFEKTPWMQAILKLCQEKYPEKTTVLNPIATPKTDYPYWENGRFNGSRPFVDNLYAYCQDVLKLAVATKSNGIVIPSGVSHRKYPNRVIIHPTSSRPGKNWPMEKFIALSDQLREKGFQPVFALTEEEKKGWPVEKIEAPGFASLSDLCTYVCESGYMIGNDSGIGHLASCLGLPTLTICRSLLAANFWRPAWSRGEVVTPSTWIPNVKGLRWRDVHWKKWVSIPKVLNRFSRLTQGGDANAHRPR